MKVLIKVTPQTKAEKNLGGSDPAGKPPPHIPTWHHAGWEDVTLSVLSPRLVP